MDEIVRLIRYDNDVKTKTENYRKMASVLGKEKADLLNVDGEGSEGRNTNFRIKKNI